MIARLALALALVATLWGQMPAARAADPAESFAQPRLELNAEADSWLLSADFEVPLTRSLDDAVRRGESGKAREVLKETVALSERLSASLLRVVEICRGQGERENAPSNLPALSEKTK